MIGFGRTPNSFSTTIMKKGDVVFLNYAYVKSIKDCSRHVDCSRQHVRPHVDCSRQDVFKYQKTNDSSLTFRALALVREKQKKVFLWRKVSLFLSDEGPMVETLDYTIRIGSTPTFSYFDLYLYSAYAAHYVYSTVIAIWKPGLTNTYLNRETF